MAETAFLSSRLSALSLCCFGVRRTLGLDLLKMRQECRPSTQSEAALMAVKPILFSGPMVQALLDGRKKQTRRVINDKVPPPPKADCHPKNAAKHATPYLDAYCSQRKTQANPRGMSTTWNWWQVDDRMSWPQFKVKYKPGDRLWVRESWHAGACADSLKPRDLHPGFWLKENGGLWYPADDHAPENPITPKGKKRPSIFMLRWASRLTLIVTDVRVQRLQDISEGDAIWEGCRPFFDELNPEEVKGPNGTVHQMAPLRGPQDDFQRLWDSLNAKRGFGWGTNPWVAAYTFTVHRCNIEELANG